MCTTPNVVWFVILCRLKSGVLKRGPPSTHTARASPVSRLEEEPGEFLGSVLGSAGGGRPGLAHSRDRSAFRGGRSLSLSLQLGLFESVLWGTVVYCVVLCLSRCVFLCASLSLSSRSLSSLSWWSVREVACFLHSHLLSCFLTCTLWLAFCVPSRYLLSCSRFSLFVLFWFSLSYSLSLWAITFGALSRSSRLNLPLVPRGIIHHSFTIRSHSSNSRSFFSLLLMTF